MAFQDVLDQIKTSAANDPRWWTTPAGMLTGVALTRALVSEKKRTPGAYAVGAGLGGAAGFGAGTLIHPASQAGPRQAAAMAAQSQLGKDPKAVVAALGEKAPEQMRRALKTYYSDKPLDWFQREVEPGEINAALATNSQNGTTYPSAKGIPTTAAGAGAAAAGAGGFNYCGLTRGANRGESKEMLTALGEQGKQRIEQLIPRMEAEGQRTAQQALATIPPGTSQAVIDATVNAAKAKAMRALGHVEASTGNALRQATLESVADTAWRNVKGRLRIASRPAGKGAAIGAAAAGTVVLGSAGLRAVGMLDPSKKKFEEALGWAERVKYLKEQLDWKKGTLDEDTEVQMRRLLEHAQNREAHARLSAQVRSWLEIGSPFGGEQPGR